MQLVRGHGRSFCVGTSPGVRLWGPRVGSALVGPVQETFLKWLHQCTVQRNFGSVLLAAALPTFAAARPV